MSFATRAVRKLARRAWTKVMDRLGGRLVSRMADTSSDAPNAFHKPKRNLYEQMKAGEQPAADSRGQWSQLVVGRDDGGPRYVEDDWLIDKLLSYSVRRPFCAAR